VNVLWIVFIAVFLAALQAWLFRALGQKKMEYHRSFNCESVHEGERVKLVEVVKNRKILPIPWLRIESRISPNLRFKVGGEDREISDDQQYHKSVFFLGPFSQITRRHEITCQKRGLYSVGTLAVTTGDLFGFAQKSTDKDIDCRLMVYPRLLSESELPTPATRWQGELIVRRFIAPDPFLMNGIREYRAGDPLRTVHWGATARTGQLQVKQFDTTADPRALVVLNVQTTEEQWGELMEYEQNIIEYGIRMAATLAVRALNCGVDAGFASNACYQGEKGQGNCIYIPAKRDANQAQTIFAAMARLQIYRELTFAHFLDDLANSVTGADIAILSCYTSPMMEASMNRLRANGNTVTMISINKENVV